MNAKRARYIAAELTIVLQRCGALSPVHPVTEQQVMLADRHWKEHKSLPQAEAHLPHPEAGLPPVEALAEPLREDECCTTS